MRQVLVLLAPLIVPALAFAQPGPAPLPQQAPPVSSPGASAGAVPTNAPVEIPPPPSVNDPMLAPVAPPPRVLQSWDEAIALVRSRSTDLRIAYDNVRRAEAQTRIVLSGTLPTLDAGAVAHQEILTKTNVTFVQQGDPPTLTRVQQRVPDPQNSLTGNIVAIQPLFVPQVWHNIGTARANEDVARLSVEELKRNIVLGVANAIVGVVTAERIAELNRVGFRNALERLDLTTRKRNLGAANGLDVVRAQQDVESARALIVTGDEALRQAREALGLALGLPEQVGVARDINIDGLEQDALRICRPTKDLEGRPDIATARRQLDVARRNVDNVYYQFSPTITARTNVSTSTVDSRGFRPPVSWNIEAVLSIPLFEGGARYGRLRDARAAADQAEQNLEALRRQGTIQVARAQRGVSVADQSRKVAFDTRALAAETDRLQRVAFQEGQGTSLELVSAAAALRQAEINLALREFELVRARILAVLSLASCPF